MSIVALIAILCLNIPKTRANEGALIH